MYWEWEYIFLIIFSTGVDFFCGTQMSKKDNKLERRPYLIISLFTNLGLLFAFKYFNFFYSILFSSLNVGLQPLDIMLPIGISFYTFQTLAYSIDIYRGNIKCEKHLGKFALYVSFFPQLVAGPIERADSLLPQLQKNLNKLKHHNIVLGLNQVIIGFFKKVVVADLIAIYVESIYGSYELHTGFSLLFATYLFAIQIYCDFSGYTDIAIGCAKILGYDLMENFRSPYFSKSITEFWHRWHISLSSWLRDYLYIPLGGSKGNKIFTYRNLMLTMLLGGLWHGAAWNFVIWGGLHGTYLIIERRLGFPKLIEKKTRIIQIISGVFTFHLVCLSWVFFRCETFDKAIEIINRIFKGNNFFNFSINDTNILGAIGLATFLFILLEFFILNKSGVKKLNQTIDVYKSITLQAVLIMIIVLFGVSEGRQFIYFQF
tara:strand:+ start:1005 stop:2294 length:1290 start_codon:yes stop_codon:yes gene_type:complete